MTSGHDVSRRAFIGGATGVGAITAALAALGLDGAVDAAAGSPGNATNDDDSALSAQALPAVIPGARVGFAGPYDAVALGNDQVTTPAPRLMAAGYGTYNAAGYLEIPLPIPGGSRLMSVDAYSYVGVAPFSIMYSLTRSTTTVSNVSFGAMSAQEIAGIQRASWITGEAYIVGRGEALHLSTSFCTTPSRTFMGAIYQYFDPNPQLNILATPVRVYDSRPGTMPDQVAKGPLPGPNYRNINCTYGGAVPVGAPAAMITLTVTGTSQAGFMALWQNGMPYPGTSSINWDHAGTNVAVTTVVALDNFGWLRAMTGPNASTDFIIDVIGFYA